MDRCPARITFGGLTARDLAPPDRAHHPLRVLPRHRLRHRTARFALSRRNSVFWRKKVQSTSCTFPPDCPNGIAIGDSGGPYSIPRGDDHHQIPIAGLADRGFVQQGFCNAASRRMRGLALGAGRRRNLIIVRSIKGGSVEPFPAAPVRDHLFCRLSSHKRFRLHLIVPCEDRAWEKLAILVLVEPRAFEIEQ
jgi:hypothetical protein